LIFLNNASGRPLDKIVVKINGMGKARRIESLKSGNLASRIEAGRLVVDVPLKDTDILRVTR